MGVNFSGNFAKKGENSAKMPEFFVILSVAKFYNAQSA